MPQPEYTKATLLLLAKSSSNSDVHDSALTVLASREDMAPSLEDLAEICRRVPLTQNSAISISKLVIRCMRAKFGDSLLASTRSWAPATINALLASLKKHMASSSRVSFALTYLYVIKFDNMDESTLSKTPLSVYELIGQALRNMLCASDNITEPALHLMDMIASTLVKSKEVAAKATLLLRALDGNTIAPESVSTLWPFVCLSVFKHPVLTPALKRKLITDAFTTWMTTRSSQMLEFKNLLSNMSCANITNGLLSDDLRDQEFLDEFNSKVLEAGLATVMAEKLNPQDHNDMTLAGCLIASHPVWHIGAQTQHRKAQHQLPGANNSILYTVYYYFRSQDKAFIFAVIEGLIKCCNACGAAADPKLRMCTCKRAWYCNEVCQRKDWRAGHKSSCAAAAKIL